MPDPHQTSRVENTLVTAVFVVVIGLPFVATVCGWGSAEPADERRRLAARPTWRWDAVAIKQYPDQFQQWFDDHFAFRPWLVRHHNWLKYRVCRVYRSEKVVIGQDRWLFYAEDGVLRDYLGVKRLTDEQLDQWGRSLVVRRNWLADRDVAYLFVFAPNKATVYGQYMPEHLRQARSATTQLDQLTAHLAEHTDMTDLLDLRPALLAAAKNHQVYLRRDTHWNPRGAMLAYQHIGRRLQTWFADLAPHAFDDFRPVEAVDNDPDLVRMLGMGAETEATEGFEPIQPDRAAKGAFSLPDSVEWPAGWMAEPFALETPGQTGTLIVFHDSFVDTPYLYRLAEHFGRTVFIWTYPTFQQLEAIVAQEQPDVVIEQRVERSVRKPPQGMPAHPKVDSHP